MAITLYSPSCDDYTTNGLCLLMPTSCIISEESCGMYELEMQHPIDATLRWAQLAVGCVIKAPAPTRESPMYEAAGTTGGIMARNIWQVTGTKSGLPLYNKNSGRKKKLETLKNGALVNELGSEQVGKVLWMNVISQNGGNLGWVDAAHLTKVGSVEEHVWNGQVVNPTGVKREQCREQLFRIYSVERDAKEQNVTVKAMHISYDLKGTLVGGTYNVEDKTPARVVLEGVFSRLTTEHEFVLHMMGDSGAEPTAIANAGDAEIPEATSLTTPITGDYSWKNPH